MATKKKMLQAAAGSAVGGAGLDIDEVFSTYLYEGTGSTQTITNGIDLDGEGGLVWLKPRTDTGNTQNNWHALYDTERGAYGLLSSNETIANTVYNPQGLSAFNSNGFSLGFSGGFGHSVSGVDYASWTFRKAPKFFDVVTYTGTGSAQTISHDLGSDVGFLLIKRTDSTGNWRCWNRGLPGTGSNMEFNQTGAYETATTIFNGTDPTSTQFSVGTNSNVNASGGTYVAYLFAHNNGDGEFGPDGDQDIIKCGSFTTNSDGSVDLVDLGFEPQWLMIKNSSTAGNWDIHDVMRDGTLSTRLRPNTSDAELSYSTQYLKAEATGFSAIAGWGGASNTKIYIAIRRGPLAQPESATEVFDVVNGGPDHNSVPFPTDFVITTTQGVGSDNWTLTRLSGDRYMRLNGTDAEGSYNFQNIFADMSGTDWATANWWSSSATNTVGWHWKRAPGFFDVVAYTGNGTNPHNISHNLAATPEMMWVKRRDSSGQWEVYYDTGNPGTNNGLGLLRLNSTGTDLNGTFVWGNTHPTDSVFTVGSNGTNRSGADFIAYLFASLPGISKVGSYTGTGATLNIDCGFTSGARFVLIKRTNNQSPWWIWDSERGIVAGNDPWLELNSTAAENTSTDYIDPYSSGFTLTSSGNWLYGMNYPSGEYIFYAIA